MTNLETVLAISTAISIAAVAFLAYILHKTTKDLETANNATKTQKEDLDEAIKQNTQQYTQIQLLEQQIQNEKDQISIIKNQAEETKKEFDKTINLALQTFTNEASKRFDQTLTTKTESFNMQQKTTLDPLNKDLKEFKEKIEKLHTQHFETKVELATSIKNLISQTQNIGEEARKLTNALSKNKQVGNWGEMVLEGILAASGLTNGKQYKMEVSNKDDEGRNKRPDCIIKFPDGRKLIIDAKTSLEAYKELQGGANLTEDERKTHIANHLLSIKSHIANLKSKKYHESVENSLDIVCMFIPIEGAFMLAVEESLKQGKDIFNEAFKSGIFIITPSTMMLTIHLIKKFWEAEKQRKNIEEVKRLANVVYQKAVDSTECFQSIGKNLTKAQEEYQKGYNQLYTGKGNMLNTLQSIQAIKTSGYVTDATRDITALPAYKEAQLQQDLNQDAKIINQNSDDDAIDAIDKIGTINNSQSSINKSAKQLNTNDATSNINNIDNDNQNKPKNMQDSQETEDEINEREAIKNELEDSGLF